MDGARSSNSLLHEECTSRGEFRGCRVDGVPARSIHLEILHSSGTRKDLKIELMKPNGVQE